MDQKSDTGFSKNSHFEKDGLAREAAFLRQIIEWVRRTKGDAAAEKLIEELKELKEKP